MKDLSPLRSVCPISAVLDIVGDKWTLLVVRDLLFFGKKRYGELVESPEGIATNILAARLHRLEDAGLVVKTPYQKNPVRHEYAVTAKGRDLKPILTAMIAWSHAHVPGVALEPPPEFNMDG
jgi:DNA-binding HxlR family transcriptional regulator